jgi:hypothetical protein
MRLILTSGNSAFSHRKYSNEIPYRLLLKHNGHIQAEKKEGTIMQKSSAIAETALREQASKAMHAAHTA